MVFEPLTRISAALLLASACTAVHAAPLTLDDALRMAEQHSRLLPAQQAAATAAREMAVAAGRRPDPVLKAGINNLPVNGPDRFSLTADFMTMRSLGVMQEWTRADKLKAGAARYEREAEAADADRQFVLASLQRDTAIAWLERHYLERMREVLLAQRDEARLQVQGAEAAYRGNRGAQADVFAARSAVAQIDDRLAINERELAAAKAMLARWAGNPPEDELGAAPDMATVRLRPEDLDAGIAHHPQVAAMLKREAAAQAQADAARAGKQPDVSLELMVSQRGPAYSNMVSLNVSIPLQWDQKNRQDRELAARLAIVEQMRAQREEETRMHIAEARTLLLQWNSNRERLGRYDRELLPLAADRTRAALVAYRAGASPLASVLDARRGEVETRMDRLRLEMETARLWAQLNYLVPVGHGTPENQP
ncbi:TolC family protein [Piscinibacter terrae]|nr:TolC family protein [Albitalea terrae]